jgi:putative transposase
VVGNDRSVTYRLHPTARQMQAIEDLLRSQRHLYNSALEERRGAYRWEGRRVTLYDQIRGLRGMASWAPELARFGSRAAAGTLVRLDEAFAGFFRRLDSGQKPGYPRFKSAERFTSVQWSNHTGSWKLTRTGKGTYGRLYIQGVGQVRVRVHRWFEGAEPRKLVVRRRGRGWEATISWRGVTTPTLPKTGRAAGIDVGVAVLAAVCDDTGRVDLIDNPKPLARSLARLQRAQRAVATCKKTRRCDGKGRRAKAKARVARLHEAVRNQRKDNAHQLSNRWVRDYDLIALERLYIVKMTRSARGTADSPGSGVAAKAGLNRSILDAGWGQLVRMVSYKAEGAGRTIAPVHAPQTSRTCARCGRTDAASRVSRDSFACTGCGHAAHADANAAEVVLAVATNRLVLAAPPRRQQPTTRPGSGHPPARTGRDAAHSSCGS